MGEHQRPVEEMATTSTAVTTVPPQVEETSERVVVTLRPAARAKERARKQVVWTADTVDNEDMNKKKSKCCCIYEKPRRFDESDSEDSADECDHCFGHVERRGLQHRHHDGTATALQETPTPEASVALTLHDRKPDTDKSQEPLPDKSQDPPPERDVAG